MALLQISAFAVIVIPRQLRLCEFFQQIFGSSSIAEIEFNLHNVNEIEQCAGAKKMLKKIHTGLVGAV